jgi:hypothetical protein
MATLHRHVMKGVVFELEISGARPLKCSVLLLLLMRAVVGGSAVGRRVGFERVGHVRHRSKLGNSSTRKRRVNTPCTCTTALIASAEHPYYRKEPGQKLPKMSH